MLLGLLQRPELIEGKTIIEIGAGTGVVPIYLSAKKHKFRYYIGFEIDELAARLCNINLDLWNLSDRSLVIGGSDTFEKEADRGLLLGADLTLPYADIVIANVPQVPILASRNQLDMCDYYQLNQQLQGRHLRSAKLGLQFVMEILDQSKLRLQSGGKVVMTVSGRCGKEQIEVAFRDSGFVPEVILHKVVPQDRDTDLSALQYFEQNDFSLKYCFYGSRDRSDPIGVRQAVEYMSAGDPVYQDLYAYVGTAR